ncbi:retrotransposon-related protein [Tanacetum coccineum]
MRKEVKQFVRDCENFQSCKPNLEAYQGLLQPLPIPTSICTSISMDFIEGLPRSQGKDVILVVVDRLSKYSHFMALSHPFTTSHVTQLFLDNVYKLHGLPENIVSDKDKIFINSFWKELFKLCMTGEQPKKLVKWLSLVEWCRAQSRMKSHADIGRTDKQFDCGDWGKLVADTFLNHSPEVAFECEFNNSIFLLVFSSHSESICLGVVECSVKQSNRLTNLFYHMKDALEIVDNQGCVKDIDNYPGNGNGNALSEPPRSLKRKFEDIPKVTLFLLPSTSTFAYAKDNIIKDFDLDSLHFTLEDECDDGTCFRIDDNESLESCIAWGQQESYQTACAPPSLTSLV